MPNPNAIGRCQRLAMTIIISEIVALVGHPRRGGSTPVVGVAKAQRRVRRPFECYSACNLDPLRCGIGIQNFGRPIGGQLCAPIDNPSSAPTNAKSFVGTLWKVICR